MALRLSCNTTKISTQPYGHAKAESRSKKCFQNVKSIVKSIGLPAISSSPLESLQRGNWVKLICGASFEDVIDIRNLSLVYTLAGVDCIDCAADASVVNAVSEGIEIARHITNLRRPWLMISVNDDKDLHFRKAEFDPEDCPADCSRPCEIVCPANAISFQGNKTSGISNGTERPGVLKDGVITERCYGCGRCFPVCPYDKIREVTYVRDALTTADLMKRDDVDAIEIHTSGRQTDSFKELWSALRDSVGYLKLIAVSLPNGENSTISFMNEVFSIMKPNLQSYNLWQLDGRPMSGDIGRGATKESIVFAVQMAKARDRPPGLYENWCGSGEQAKFIYELILGSVFKCLLLRLFNGFLQLAGGTNAHTINGLKKEGLFQTASVTKYSEDATSTTGSADSSHALIGGVAYGGYARKIVGRALRAMQSQHGVAACVEDHPQHLLVAVKEALALIGPFKHQ